MEILIKIHKKPFLSPPEFRAFMNSSAEEHYQPFVTFKASLYIDSVVQQVFNNLFFYFFTFTVEPFDGIDIFNYVHFLCCLPDFNLFSQFASTQLLCVVPKSIGGGRGGQSKWTKANNLSRTMRDPFPGNSNNWAFTPSVAFKLFGLTISTKQYCHSQSAEVQGDPVDRIWGLLLPEGPSFRQPAPPDRWECIFHINAL